MGDRLTKYILDGASGVTLLAGVFTGQVILMVLGGCASVMAFINHFDQYWKRNKKEK